MSKSVKFLIFIFLFGLYSGIELYDIPYIFCIVSTLFLFAKEKFEIIDKKYFLFSLSILTSLFIFSFDSFLLGQEILPFIMALFFALCTNLFIKKTPIVISIFEKTAIPILAINLLQIIFFEFFDLSIYELKIEFRNFGFVRPHVLAREPSDIAKYFLIGYSLKFFYFKKLENRDYIIGLIALAIIRSPMLLLIFSFYLYSLKLKVKDFFTVIIFSSIIILIIGPRLNSILNFNDLSFEIRFLSSVSYFKYIGYENLFFGVGLSSLTEVYDYMSDKYSWIRDDKWLLNAFYQFIYIHGIFSSFIIISILFYLKKIKLKYFNILIFLFLIGSSYSLYFWIFISMLFVKEKPFYQKTKKIKFKEL